MDTITRLSALVGKEGLMTAPVPSAELPITLLAVDPAPEVTSEMDIQIAITRSNFIVRFDNGDLVDGGNTKTISGFYISTIKGPY
jgi:hypothetical protein